VSGNWIGHKVMQRAEFDEEQLWSHIQERKQTESTCCSCDVNAGSDDSGASTDALLVSVLFATLEEDRAATPDSAATSRALLKAAIGVDVAARNVRYPRKLKFWQPSGRRHSAAVVALCLITVAALGYLIWYLGPGQSNCNETPPQPRPPKLRSASPVSPGKSDRQMPNSSAQNTLSFVGVKAETPLPKVCNNVDRSSGRQ